MFKATLRADESTDAAAVADKVRAQAKRAGVKDPHLEFMHTQLQAVLGELVEAARLTSSTGSQINASRTFQGDGYQIELIMRGNDKRSFLAKLFDSLRGQ